MRNVVEQVENIFEGHLSQSTVHYWIHKYARLVKGYVDTLKPELGGKYHHDETEVKVDGNGRYFWETIDEDTRFIVTSLLTESRNSSDALKYSDRLLKSKDPILSTQMAHLPMMRRITRSLTQGLRLSRWNGFAMLESMLGKQTILLKGYTELLRTGQSQ